MNIKKMITVTLTLIFILTLSPAGMAQAASGTFATPKFQDEFNTWFDNYGEGYYNGRMRPTMDSKDYAVAIYDQKMKRIAVLNYDYGEGFHDGLMAVGKEPKLEDMDVDTYVNDPTQLLIQPKYGYADTTGKLVIPCKYYEVSNFKNGLAIVHKLNGDKVTTLVINKKDQVQFQVEGLVSGEIGDNYIYFDDAYREPGYDEDGYNPDVDGSFMMRRPGSFYDYKWNRISIASRKGTSDQFGYWTNSGERIDVEGYNKGEKDAFEAKFGKLYQETEYLGKGFFKVKEHAPAGTEEFDYDVLDNLKTGVVNKDNKIIVPMGSYPNMVVHDTETSKFFELEQDDYSTTGIALYSGTGKKVLNAGTFTDVCYMGGGGIYYAKMSNIGWGMITLDGKPIVPFSKKFLSCMTYYGGNASVHHYANPPRSNITFFTTANMNEKADTANLKALVAKAKEISKKHKDSRLSAAIANANSVIASKSPRWLDVSTIEVELIDAAYCAK